MDNNKIRKIEVVLLIVVLLILFWFSEQSIAVGLISSPYDKIAHATFGASVAFILWLIFKGGFSWANIGIVGLLSALEEWHQSFLPGRVPDFYDFLAAAGAAFFCVMLLRFRKGSISS